ncbi:MAG: hypothetical protein HOV94_10265 [Saccharothrix sp.]|nr:hypothetical protein [Saccharothrix sp.]
MTFRRGFVAIAYSLLGAEQVQDASGTPVQVDTGTVIVTIEPNTLLEVDDAFVDAYYSRVRIPVPDRPGLYFVDNVFTSSIKDVRDEHAATRIAAIERVDGLAVLVKAARRWAKRGIGLAWTARPPHGLATGEWTKVTASDEHSITVRSGAGREVVVPVADFHLADVDFERTAEEQEKRAEKLERNKELPVLGYGEALAHLKTVPVLSAVVSKAGHVPITVAKDSAEFEDHCVRYLMRSPQFHGREAYARAQAEMVNGYTDRVGDSPSIHLRPGTQGSGIEVHESVHTLCSPDFEAMTSFFLSEGITEFFTRLAVGNAFKREDFYDTEHFFVSKLVELGASSPEILAALYFGGDWAGFHQGLRDGVGDLVGIRVVLDRAADDQAVSALKYLRELKADPEAPLRPYLKK